MPNNQNKQTTQLGRRALPTSKASLGTGLGGGKVMRLTTAIKINLVFLVLLAVGYMALFLHPPYPLHNPGASSLPHCSSRRCAMDYKIKGAGRAMKMIRERPAAKVKIPDVLDGFFPSEARIALVNMGDDEAINWEGVGQVTWVQFDRVSANLQWRELFPEWIDEEEENEVPQCPEIPMPDLSMYGAMDVVVARIPCKGPKEGWSRDVFRLQLHLAVANLVVKRAVRDGRGKVKVAISSPCMPMMEVFRCKDLLRKKGDWWLYEAEVGRLEQKVALPVGSCNLALPLWLGTNQENDLGSLSAPANSARREAYATVLHSSVHYVCGAIALAHALKKTGTTRDLVLLHDESIPHTARRALTAAGWSRRLIKRIRNPHGPKTAYNKYNYSKLRLWQLTDYHKVIFVDADVLVLRNLDFLFRFPEMAAVGNDGVIFNSGVMVIEPSNCTFNVLMERRKEVVSYNGGDQGFLNEMFVWWHRLPRRVNFLKNFWSNTSMETSLKNYLFQSDPPELYAVHYLGLKPWLCYRDYDCNWNVGNQRVYASDVAHQRWWTAFDIISEEFKGLCGLSPGRKTKLEKEREKAKKTGYEDGHWRLEIIDGRRNQ